MTGIGAYYYIVWICWLRYCLTGRHRDVRLVWPSVFFSMPEVVRVDKRHKAKTPQAVNGLTRELRKRK